MRAGVNRLKPRASQSQAMKQELEEKLVMAQQRAEKAERALDEMVVRARTAEDQAREAQEIMLDLLSALGIRDLCAKCGAPTFWLRPRGFGGARLYNLDGTEHWPCPGGQVRNLQHHEEERTNL